MPTYRVKTIVPDDGRLILSNLPFHAGEAVEVIVLTRSGTIPRKNPYPLRGTPITYIDPTKPVAEADWDALR